MPCTAPIALSREEKSLECSLCRNYFNYTCRGAAPYFVHACDDADNTNIVSSFQRMGPTQSKASKASNTCMNWSIQYRVDHRVEYGIDYRVECV